jgi:hypothetical protein
MNARDEEPTCTPTKMTNDERADRVEPNGQMDFDDDSDDELPGAKPKRK